MQILLKKITETILDLELDPVWTIFEDNRTTGTPVCVCENTEKMDTIIKGRG